ncbi:hypothetical protein [Zavarzinia aquatilis]|uniref:hypothetical protein n=1 Tax=Zavarzinia aquatilis TaxID=2211142 RepID=UPI00105789E9|nr:hypothetical protein [Zavarzinia aquatilis]
MTLKQSQATDNFTRGVELVKQQTRIQFRSAISFILIMTVISVGLWLTYLIALSTATELDATAKWAIAWLQVNTLHNANSTIRITTTAGPGVWPATVQAPNSSPVSTEGWFFEASPRVAPVGSQGPPTRAASSLAQGTARRARAPPMHYRNNPAQGSILGADPGATLHAD